MTKIPCKIVIVSKLLWWKLLFVEIFVFVGKFPYDLKFSKARLEYLIGFVWNRYNFDIFNDKSGYFGDENFECDEHF